MEESNKERPQLLSCFPLYISYQIDWSRALCSTTYIYYNRTVQCCNMTRTVFYSTCTVQYILYSWWKKTYVYCTLCTVHSTCDRSVIVSLVCTVQLYSIWYSMYSTVALSGFVNCNSITWLSIMMTLPVRATLRVTLHVKNLNGLMYCTMVYCAIKCCTVPSCINLKEYISMSK